jgi:aryl-alcohol dehydrogenase-like predicted oxidoreductase
MKVYQTSSCSLARALHARHIDCAEMYHNQDEVGRSFDKIFKEGGKVRREDVWITSKVLRVSWEMHSSLLVHMACCEPSFGRLHSGMSEQSFKRLSIQSSDSAEQKPSVRLHVQGY